MRKFLRPFCEKAIRIMFKLGGISPLSYTHNLLGYQNSDLETNGELKVILKLRELYGNPTIFDIGANVGSYSNLLTKYIKDVSVYAFEPNTETFASLLNNKDLNAFNLAFGSDEGTANLFVPEDDLRSKHSTFHSKALFRKSHYNSVEVARTTIDSFCEREGIGKVDFLKIDTEGHEKDVLLGAQTVLSTVDLIQIEMNYHWVFNSTYLKDIYDLLPEFSFFRITPNSLFPLGNYDNRNEIFIMHNILAIRKDSVSDWSSLISSKF